MAKMTPLLLRLEPELVEKIDALRGDVPRAAFIRRRLADSFLPKLADASSDATESYHRNEEAAFGLPSRPKPSLTLDDVRPKQDYGARLKPDKGAKQ